MAFIDTATRSQLIELYVAYFNRAPDADGLAYWSDKVANGGWTVATVARSFMDQTEVKSTYPDYMTSSEIVTKVYTNVLGRAADAAGQTYWVNQLNTGKVTKADLIQAVVNAAKSSTGTAADAATLANKTSVGEYFAVTLGSNDKTKAASVMAGVTSDAATVETAKTAAQSANGQTFTLTTGVDSVTGTAGNDTFIGANDVLSASDSIVGGAGTDTLNYTHAVAGGLPAASISGVEIMNVRAVTSAVNSSDLSLYSGLTTFNSDRSNVDITVTNLANGGTFGIIGNGTVTNAAAANFGYAAAATAGVINISGGTLGASAVTLTGAGLLSTTINSTGAANVIGNFADAATSKALTINATTGLTTGTIGDSAARTALTINATGDVTTGAVTSTNTAAAATVAITGTGKVTTDLNLVVAPTITVAGSGVVSIGTLNAATTTVTSTQTAGGLTATMNATATTKLTGGAGNDVITTGAVLTTGSINAGGGTADRLIVAASTHIDATTGAKHSGFEQLQVQNGVSVDASQLAANNTLTSAIINQSGTAATGITNMNATTAGAVKVIAAGGTGVITFGIKDATVAGNIDTLKLTLDDGATTVGNFILTAPAMSGIENLEIAASENFTISALTAATALSSVKVTGAGNSNVATGAVDFAANSTFDFSAATGTVVFDASAAQAGATATGLSIKGSSTKANTLSGSAKADVITGGAGDDVITGGNGNDSINLSAGGVDKLIFSAVASNGADTITGFTAGTGTGADILRVDLLTTLDGTTSFTQASSASKANALNNKVIAITDQAAADWADVVTVMQNANTGSDATATNERTVILIDNGTDTRVYTYVDDATAGITSAELTLVGTLIGVDAAALVAANFVFA